MTAEVLVQGLVSGLLMGFVYALIAAGLSLIFGLMEIVNFAPGEFLMGAMFSFVWKYRYRPGVPTQRSAAVRSRVSSSRTTADGRQRPRRVRGRPAVPGARGRR